MYIENSLKKIRIEDIRGIQINGKSVQMLVNFTGNITMIAETEKNLGDMLTKINNSFKKYNLKLTKVIQKY